MDKELHQVVIVSRKDRFAMVAHDRAVLALVALLAGCASNEQPSTSGTGGTTAVVPGSQEDLVANVGDRVFFDFDRATLNGTGSRTANNLTTLDKQAAWLAQYPQNNVQIAGNCDERGTEEYNLALGDRRAHAAQAYLVGKGIAGARMTAISYGKERPTAVGSDEDAWSQNRNAITSVR
jgi:peptidoglycan-associated lipoprotein